MKVNAMVAVEGRDQVRITLDIEGNVSTGYGGERAPVIGALEKGMLEARKTAIATLEQMNKASKSNS